MYVSERAIAHVSIHRHPLPVCMCRNGCLSQRQKQPRRPPTPPLPHGTGLSGMNVGHGSRFRSSRRVLDGCGCRFHNNLARSEFIRVKIWPRLQHRGAHSVWPRRPAPSWARTVARYCWIQREPLADVCDDGCVPRGQAQTVAFQ